MQARAVPHAWHACVGVSGVSRTPPGKGQELACSATQFGSNCDEMVVVVCWLCGPCSDSLLKTQGLALLQHLLASLPSHGLPFGICHLLVARRFCCTCGGLAGFLVERLPVGLTLKQIHSCCTASDKRCNHNMRHAIADEIFVIIRCVLCFFLHCLGGLSRVPHCFC